MKFLFALLCLIPLFSPHKIVAQQTAGVEKVQKGNKTLVSVPVSVNDRDGRYIAGLKKEDFKVYRDGAEQKIAHFATYDEPVNIALLIDTSGSTSNTLPEIKEAAENFIELMNPNDRCLIATFDAQINVLSNLTSNQKALKDALAKIVTAQKEGSVLLNAVSEIAQKSFAGAPGRKAIVVLSDGKDYGSTIARNELLNRLEESDASIYSIFYQTGTGFNKMKIDPNGQPQEAKPEKKPKEKKPKKKKKGYSIVIPGRGDVYTPEEVKLSQKLADIEAVNVLQKMSDTTAGRFYLSDTPKLREVFRQIAGELRQQYRLGFYSPDADAALHEIVVKVDRPNVVVRARGKFRGELR